MSTLECTYIGHQSWTISTACTTILVDPVLTDSFGFRDDLRFTIYPPRTVAHAAMPKSDAVVITNEHLDHFHPPSLQLLDTNTPVIVPLICPAVVTDWLATHGFPVVALPQGAIHHIGDIQIALFGVADRSPLWEHRVHSAMFTTVEDPGVLIQSDGEIDYSAIASAGMTPRVLIATNNAQIPVQPGNGAFANIIENSLQTSTEGLRIVRAVVDVPASELGSVRQILLSGAGYTYDDPDAPPLFRLSDSNELADIVSCLSLGVELIGLAPGEQAGADGAVGTADWIIAGQPNHGHGGEGHEEPWSRSPRPRHINGGTASLERIGELILDELRCLEPILINSKLGQTMVSANTYLGNDVDSTRLYLHLRGGDDDFIGVGFDLAAGRFESSAATLRDAIMTIPFGLDVYADDFLDVLHGRRQIWEVCTASAAQWFDGPRDTSPVAFLYEALSEQVRPDLARELIRQFDGPAS
ncbi:MBL fold metallo-hydrolase [Gordonia sp. PKS22-38]|uniref:MBL fold metallo-hydrolase n=1 Tax=Gordonia prachuapensis TaxID=3115651 RepID=A0ABU7N0K3_9ACTN|nr:MBL fold metallo-hydrolase [Gordonia sp. PKS22-38]